MRTYICTHGTRGHTAQQQRIHVHTRASTALPARCARAESLSSIKTFSKRRCRRSHCSSPGSKESARWPLRARASECRDSKDRQKNANPIGKGGSHPSGKGASSSVKQSSAPIPGRPSTRARPRWCWLLLPLAQTQTEAQTQTLQPRERAVPAEGAAGGAGKLSDRTSTRWRVNHGRW